VRIKEKTLKVYRQPGIDKLYPEIRLSGKWLEMNGFQVGDYIRIAYKPTVILIKKMDMPNGNDELPSMGKE
jgi:hypothetical protein